MANPRLAVSFSGIGALSATFLIDNSTITYAATSAGGSAVVGRAVTMDSDDTVKLAGDGDPVVGKLLKVEPDDVATVQIIGVMELPGGAAASLTLGKKIVGAASAVPADGYIREVATATAAELGLMRGRILDAGTTTAVVVEL